MDISQTPSPALSTRFMKHPLHTSPLVNYRKSIFGTYDFQDLYHQGDFPNEKYKFNVELVMIW